MKKNKTSQWLPWYHWQKAWVMFKLSLVFVCCFILDTSAKTMAQQEKVSLNMQAVSFQNLFNEIQKQTKLAFLFNHELVDDLDQVSIQVQNETVEKVLNTVFENTDLTYTIQGNIIIVKKKSPEPTAMSQGQSQETTYIRGNVKDSEGNPLPGVAVMIDKTTIGVSSDANGNFEIVKPQGAQTVALLFTFVGMKPKNIVWKGEEYLNVVLEDEIYELETANVVQTGYQTIDRRHLTSSITSVKAEDILVPGMTSIDQALEGRIPDLILINNSGEVGATPRIQIRGTSTIIGNRQPLWVLDGVVLTDPVDVAPEDLNNPDYINIIGNAIAGINPQDIERIDVLKDASATALYGTQAANGVIVVTTKRGTSGKIRISYSHSSKITRRPRYSDRNINLMNSQERMQFGKDLVDDHYYFPENMTMVGYEGAYYNWMNGKTNYNEFLQEVQRYERENTDWFDLLTRDAYSHSHTLSISGGSNSIRYYSSFGISQDDGVSKTSYSDRYSVMMNLDAKLSDKFTAALRINANILNKNHVPTEVDAMNYAYNTTRALPCFNADGSLYYYKKYNSQLTPLNYNILNEIDNSSQEYAGNTAMITMDLRYNITDYWNANITGSYTQSNTRQEDWWGEKSWYAASLRNAEENQTPPAGDSGYCYLPYGGILKTNISDARNMMLRIQSNFNKYVDEAQTHLIASSMGFEVTSSKNFAISDENRGYLKDRGKQFVDMGTSSRYTDDKNSILLDDYPYYKKWLATTHRSLAENLTNKVSGYLTLSYSYKELFTLNLNGRFDASNKFGSESNNRLLPVWSVSGMANLREIFFKNRYLNAENENYWLTEARLRMSFGQQGNMIDGETPDMLLNQGAIDTYYGEYVSTLYKLPNPNLKWEVTNQTNIGFDLNLFDGRLLAMFEVYLKKTHDLISAIEVSSVNGVPGGVYNMNNGDMSNKGLSISLSGYPIRTKNFKWYLSTYYSVNLNKVQTEPIENYSMSDFLNGYAIISGKPISTFYSYKFLGLDPNTGIPMFDDWEDRINLLYGKSVADIMMMVLEDSGCRDPYISGSFNNNITYKNWSLSFNLAYSLGSKVRLFEMYNPIQNGITSIENIRKEFTERWIVPGDEQRTNYPVLLSPNDPNYSKYRTHWSNTANHRGLSGAFAFNIWQMYDQSDIRVVSGNYLKLQSLNLNYRFNDSLLKKTPFSTVSLSFSTQNLFTISAKELKGQDPSQAGFSQPSLSVRPTYTIGLNVSFK